MPNIYDNDMILVEFKIDLTKPNRNKRIFSSIPIIKDGIYLGTYLLYYPKEVELIENEYRKFIEENKYGRIGDRRGTLSVPRVQLTTSHGNNIKYDPRRLFNDMGK